MTVSDKMSHLRKNLGKPERLASIAAGSYFTYAAFKNKSFLRGAIAGYLLFRGATGHCSIYEALSQREGGRKGENINIKTSFVVARPRLEVYRFWRHMENLPHFMKHLSSVEKIDLTHSKWKVDLPENLGSLEWINEIVKDEPGRRIGWRSSKDSPVENAGNVHFEDAGNNHTEVHVVISYKAPMGTPGEGVARLLNPLFEDVINKDLANFKKYFENE